MQEKISLTVKDWSDDDKPREKLIHRGPKALSNAELVAILLRSGSVGKNAVDLGLELLSRAGNSLNALSRMDHAQMAKTKGMGLAKCTSLIAALELGLRMQTETAGNEVVIHSSDDIFRYMMPQVANLDHEEFWLINLNTRNKVISRKQISIGGQTESPVDLRILYREALESKATGIALVHNHPSGNLKPSTADKALTDRIVEIGRLMQICVLDHLIIGINADGKADYYSFCDNQLL